MASLFEPPRPPRFEAPQMPAPGDDAERRQRLNEEKQRRGRTGVVRTSALGATDEAPVLRPQLFPVRGKRLLGE